MFNKELGMIRVNSIPEIFKAKKPSLVQLSKNIGNEKVIAMLQLFIVSIDNFLDLSKRMKQDNIQETARLIYTKHYALTLTDIIFVFNQAKMGVYGELKYSINGQQIMYWFDRHFADRCDSAFNESYSEHLEKTADAFGRSSSKMKNLKEIFKNDLMKNNSEKDGSENS